MPRPSPPVLLVDDDEFVRRAMRRALGSLGYDAVDATSGEAALEELARGQFTFALVDLRMPGMGGHAAIRAAAAKYPTLPLVGMSGNGDMNDVLECLREGAVDFLVKPWTSAELDEVVRRTLARKATPSVGVPIHPDGGKPFTAAQQLAQISVPPPPAKKSARGKPSLSFILGRLRRGEIALPAQPVVALVVRRLIGRSDCSAAQLKDVIERDAHLSGRTLRIANGAAFAGVGRVSDLRAAIARIGNREIGVVVDTLVARQFYEVVAADARVHVETYWQRAWARAVAVRLIARKCGGGTLSPETAYLAGLFCDAGAAFMVRVLSAELGCELREAELSAINESHAAISTAIATAWELPPEVIEGCRGHHDPGPAASLPPILRLLGAANLVCDQLALPQDPHPIAAPADLLSTLGIDQRQLEAIAAATADSLQSGAELTAD